MSSSTASNYHQHRSNKKNHSQPKVSSVINTSSLYDGGGGREECLPPSTIATNANGAIVSSSRSTHNQIPQNRTRRRRSSGVNTQSIAISSRSSSSSGCSPHSSSNGTNEIDDYYVLETSQNKGNIHSIEELFAASAIDPNQCNKHGESLLHYCAGLGQLDIFKFLCQIGANLNVLDDQDDTVIHWAARQNHPHIIRYIYEQTASVEMVNKNLETPLHVAARYGHVEAIEQLCKCGANINAIDEHGETAILIAVWHGFPKIVHILGEIGANTNIRNKEDETALHVASARGHHECVRCLLDAGADANLRNKNSYTPLHLALKRQHSAVAMLLLKSGADYELADSSGERAIHYVARYNLVPICQWLCQSLNGTTNLPSTPTSGTPPTTPTMITNTIGGHQSSGQSLSLSSQQSQPPPQPRCNVNVPNKHGLYPLHIAAKSGHIEIVRTLCLAGSIVDQRDKDSIIPQICAIAQSHNDIADLLTRLRNERQKEEFIGQLSQTNQQPLNRIKLRIFGHCASGKSTLIESMKCGYFSSWFRRSKVANGSQMLRSKSVQTATNSSYATTNLNTTTSISTTTTTTSISSLVQPIETVSGQLPLSSSSIINHHQSPISSYENATKGIDCQQLYISGVGDLSLWEFSGNPIYYQLYDHFISDLHCLNAIVFRLADPPEVQLQSILFWLQFISSRQQITEPLLHCGKSAQHSRVILIATHADLVIQSGFYGTGTESEIVTHLNQMLANVCLKYGNQFDIYEQIFMMDASVAGSAGMKQLKAHLQQAKQSVLTNQYVLPYSTRFLDSVLTFLNLFRKVSTNFPVLAYHQFKDMIRSQINPLASDDHFKDLIEQLVIMGEICFLRTNSVANCDLLVLNPKWLCCDIIGNLLLLKCNPSRFINSLPQLPNTILSSHVNGIYSIDEFQELYSDVDALDLLQLLETLSLCTQNDRSGDIEYEFPCFILSGDIDQTMDHFQYRENCVYHGVVYHRSIGGNVNGPVLTSIFPRIQTNLRSYLRKHSTYDVDDLHNCLNYSYFISSSESSDEHTNDSDEHDHHQNRMMAIISVDTVSDWIDVRFCCPFDHRCDAFHLMQELLHSIELTITEVAPGLLYRKSYYSPEQLKNQRENYSLFSSASLMRSMLGMGPDSSNNKNTNSSKVNTTTSSSYQLLKRTVRSDDSLVEERICDILCFGITNLSDIGQPIPGGGTVEPSLAHELHSSNLSVMTKQQLCQLLDPPESIGRDWCMFGILLGMTDKLPKLDPTTGSRDSLSAQMIAMNQIPSPTARVIEECVRSATCTIKILVEKLTELNRFDAVDVILQTGPLLRTFPLSSLPEEGTVYNDESSHTSLGISTMSHTSSSNLSR
ncbi:hypothetical protein RDWZM_004511 [Blomia tropicalis]|uniref:Roc domain-containing protein n=1 Tax=Blomia tropicalis TaxID=40697 RepID=A0A9Q0M4F6_BLOTA|nr:hypothetical protein RDWZM_004511 [Blomia tropicalis]